MYDDREPHVGSSLGGPPGRGGRLEEATETAIKRVLAWQIEQAMRTSRAWLDRLLDPENTSVTLHTMQRAAATVGRRFRLELV